MAFGWDLKILKMEKTMKYNIILIGMIAGYVVLINLVAPLVAFQNSGAADSNSVTGNDGGGVKVGMSDSVSVTVQRNRWYGKIIENAGDDSRISYVYLFNFLRLPLIANKFNFVYVHILMLIAIMSVSVFFWRRKKDKFYVPF